MSEIQQSTVLDQKFNPNQLYYEKQCGPQGCVFRKRTARDASSNPLPQQIGSFRNSITLTDEDWKLLFAGTNLHSKIFDSSNLSPKLCDPGLLYTALPTSELNAGAFGRSYKICNELQKDLKDFAEQQPDVFYDQVLLNLMEWSKQIVDEFFCCGGQEDASSPLSGPLAELVFLPNASIGMKCVLETLIRKGGHREIGALAPLYGATRNCLDFLMNDSDCGNSEARHARVIDIGVDHPEMAFEESEHAILKMLDIALKRNPHMTVLCCDEISSQTGRILPLEAVGQWCEEKGILLIVDGTQGIDFSNTSQKLKYVDYYVLSTHKWLGNVKTAGIVRWRRISSAMIQEQKSVQTKNILAPIFPPAVSFGYAGSTTSTTKQKSSIKINKNNNDQHQIVLNKNSSRSFSPLNTSEEDEIEDNETIISTTTATVSIEPSQSTLYKEKEQQKNENPLGIINGLPDKRFQWLGMLDSYISYITLGKALEIFTKYGENQVLTASNLLNEGISLLGEGQMLLDKRRTNGTLKNKRTMQIIAIHNVRQRYFPHLQSSEKITSMMFQNFLQDVHGIFVSVKSINDIQHGCGCNKIYNNDTFFLRISCWSHNTIHDFQRLHNVLNHNMSLEDLIQLLCVAFPEYAAGGLKSTHSKHTLCMQRMMEKQKESQEMNRQEMMTNEIDSQSQINKACFLPNFTIPPLMEINGLP